jgi:integrase/recombinase XerD
MAKDLITVDRNVLVPAQFGDLAEVPPEIEWLANLTNPKTRRAYKNDVEEFVRFTGLRGIAELRDITRAHVIAWRKDLEQRALAPSSIRRKLSALSALFDYLCEHNAAPWRYRLHARAHWLPLSRAMNVHKARSLGR